MSRPVAGEHLKVRQLFAGYSEGLLPATPYSGNYIRIEGLKQKKDLR